MLVDHDPVERRQPMGSVYVGIDLHKRVSQVASLNEGTGEVRQLRLANDDAEAWEEAFADLGDNVEVAVEATGNWMWLADWLQERGCKVHLAHPLRVRLIAESRNKNDRVDAEALLRLLRGGWLPEAYLAPASVRAQRDVLRLRQGLVRMRTEVKNRLHALLGRHNLNSPVSDLFGRRGRAYLEAVELPAVSARSRQTWLTVLDGLSEQIRRVEKPLKESLKDDPRAVWAESLPGVGKLTAHLLLAEIGPIERFARPEKLVSYAGLCPSTRASADKVHQGSTGRAGRAYLKWALIESAHTAARYDPYFAKVYARLARHKGAGKAIVAVARKMTKILWHMLKEGRPYRAAPSKKRLRVGSTAPVAGSRQ